MGTRGGANRKTIWERLDTPTKVISAIVAVAAVLVGAAFAVVGNPFSADPQDVEALKSPGAVAAHQVTECMREHELPAPRVQTGDPLENRTFKRCDWPPLTATSTDGYSEIRATVADIPGRSAADEFNNPRPSVETAESCSSPS